ncbi:TonB-dependent receptor domain-containing protein [uncultured Sunxiuqinia sp.]|uniref:TonB-dependent receptor plug domain-containing protein n=1 Tax=uncultured Sunxiuqinia sp. TaxID=1573825 RepID=UPI002AA7B2F6|nr:TonB-dependent receptor [uncultured Sunxiuqinia sp.]
MKTKKIRIPLKWIVVAVIVLSFQFVQAEILDTLNVEEVVVKASRLNAKLKNIPQKVEIITVEDINSVPNESLAEVIKRTTNIDIIQYPGISATVGMRGFSPSAHSRSYTLILINGKPSGTRNLASISTTNIERVEIVKGPYSSMFGSDAMGGVINIITKTASDELSGNISLTGGSFKYSAIDAAFSGQLMDGLNFDLGYSRTSQGKDYKIGDNNFLSVSDEDKIILDKESYGSRMENSKYELSAVSGGLSASFGKVWNVDIRGAYTFADDIETPGNFWGSYVRSLKDLNRLNLYTTVERKTENNTFSFSPYLTRERNSNYSDNSAEGFISFKDNVKEYGFQLQDMQSFGELKTIVGVDYGTYDYGSERFSDKTTPAAPYKPNNKNVNTGIFTQLSYTYLGLGVNGGLRYDHYSYHIDANEDLTAEAADENYNTLNFSLGAQARILDNLKLHSSFGTAFSVPDAYKVAGKYEVSEYFPDWDYWYVESFVGNPDLKPEKSSTIDFGLKYAALDQALNIDATYFKTNHKDKITEELLESGEKTYTNANKSKMEGLELVSSFDFGVLADRQFKLELYSNWTFMFESELEFKLDDGLIEYKDMQYVSKSSGSFGFKFDNLKGLFSRLNARYIGSRLESDSFSGIRTDWSAEDYYTEKRYTKDDKIIKHEGTIVFDYSLAYQFTNGFSIQGNINNVLDENYTEKDGYNMQGRSFQLKLGYSF